MNIKEARALIKEEGAYNAWKGAMDDNEARAIVHASAERAVEAHGNEVVEVLRRRNNRTEVGEFWNAVRYLIEENTITHRLEIK